MPFGGRSWCSMNSSLCRNGSSTASRICSIWSRRPADVVVVDVRHLFEDQLLDLGLRDPLVDVARPRLEQQRVAGAKRSVEQRVGEHHDALFVGVAEHQRPVAALEHLLEQYDVALPLEAQRLDDVQRLVEHDFLAAPQLVELDRRRDRHPQLAAAGEDVDGAVLVGADVVAVSGRRLGQPVDLFLQRHDLVARFLEGRGKSLVLVGEAGEAGLRLGQPLLEATDLAG